MDATTLGAILACVGVLSGSVVAYIGKRGETGLSRFNSMTDQTWVLSEGDWREEELTAKRTELAAVQTELAALHRQRHDDLIEITRLQIKVIQLGGDPSP